MLETHKITFRLGCGDRADSETIGVGIGEASC